MSRARTLAGAIGSDGALNVADVAGLAAVASSGSASDLTTGSLPVARLPNAGLELGLRNRIINGDMRIDQRNAGASISFPAGDGNYCLDRWRLQRQGAGTMTVQQVTSAPAGFTNAIRFTVTGTSTPSATDFYTFGQLIEGFNTADLAWGTASAQAVTLSFWINSSVTGTYSASVYNWAGGSNNAYPATFTVNAANTWEYKTITIPGATAGTWVTNNLGSVYFRIDLGSGSNYSTATANAWNTSGLFRTNSSVNFISNASATLTVTGVQLEAGTVATPFERRDYGRELMMCQRYYQTDFLMQQGTYGYFLAYFGGSNAVSATCQTQVAMRATPTATVTNSSIEYYSYSGVWTATTLLIAAYNSSAFFGYCASDGDGRGKLMRTGSGGANPAPYYILNAEL